MSRKKSTLKHNDTIIVRVGCLKIALDKSMFDSKSQTITKDGVIYIEKFVSAIAVYIALTK